MTYNRVLHFDDEPLFSISLDNVLKTFGWDVTLVSEVDDLFSKLENKQFDVLIMDIMAPLPSKNNPHVTFTNKEIDEMNDGMNTGVILSEKIWQMEKYRDIPVLFLTARKLPHIIQSYLEKGKSVSYLVKPELSINIDMKLKELMNE